MVPLLSSPGRPTISVYMYVISSDILALLGVDILDMNWRNSCTVGHRVIRRTIVNASHRHGKETIVARAVPLTMHGGHLKVKISESVLTFFNKQQWKKLQKLYSQFSYSSADKLFELLREARPEDTTPETRELLEEVYRAGDPCQRIKHAPNRFTVSFGGKHVHFNDEIIMDITYREGKPVLHIVDAETQFVAACFVSDVRTNPIWRTFVHYWIVIYTGSLHQIRVYQGTAFGDGFTKGFFHSLWC